MNGLLRGVSEAPGLRHIQVAPASPAPPCTSPPRGRSTPTHRGRRAGSGGGDSPAAGAEMPSAAVSPSPGGDSRPVGRAGAWPPLPAAPAAPGPAAPSARASPPPHNRPGVPRPRPPPPRSRLPGLPGRQRRPGLTCHVPNPTTDGGASRPREGRGQRFTVDKGRRHVRARMRVESPLMLLSSTTSPFRDQTHAGERNRLFRCHCAVGREPNSGTPYTV